ncbi:MAG TPA: hypothetical protein VKL99_01855 [Candidatus Angelobacter sp.]|nr:hypothetical protein [Candidatus Angelobacter sp.]
MKTTLVRLLALVSLATSLTGFATASESKRHDANVSAAQQNGCASAAEENKKQRKQKKTPEKSQEEQDYAHMLMGIYG